MEKENYSQMSLGEIVTNDFRAASIFKQAGLDFCCGGKKSLESACLEGGRDLNEILSGLEALGQMPSAPSLNFKEWDLTFLADYIINTHHRFVKNAISDLLFYTKKIADVHGAHHPELLEVAALFKQVADELEPHLQKEEEVLFPAIKRVIAGNSADVPVIASEIERMSGEHESAGGAMDKINSITNGYKVPPDACNTYSLTFKLLEQFEDDLHIHVHLENNILFPKALLLS